MAKQVVPLGFRRYVLQENSSCLNELNINISIVKIQNAYEMFHHIILTKDIKIIPFILFRKNNILRQRSNNFNIKVLIAMRNLNNI